VSSVIDIFLECDRAINKGILIKRESSADKEFHFQNWFRDRLKDAKINCDAPGRNSYPDFTLVNSPEGFELKGLAFPGRDASYDCNSQVPTGLHNGRTIYYVFGRYPQNPDKNEYPVYDLVVLHGDFLNADHNYVHENKSIKCFGTYGDIMIRDRKMYVAPTPFALTDGTQRQITLILPKTSKVDGRLKKVGALTRIETDKIVVGYSFDLRTNQITPSFINNSRAGTKHEFIAYRPSTSDGPKVTMTET
jgi:hypothetical protein